MPKVEFVSAPGVSAANVYRAGRPVRPGHRSLRVPLRAGARPFPAAERASGHTVDEVLAHTGFDFDLPDAVPETPAPSAKTLALIRGPVGAAIAETYPRFAAEVLAIDPSARAAAATVVRQA